MLEFNSASTRLVNSDRAIDECMEIIRTSGTKPWRLFILHASIGHNLRALCNRIRAHYPHARVVGASCAGVVGREGVSETLKDVAVMAVSGQETVVQHVTDIFGSNSFEKGAELASSFKNVAHSIRFLYLLASGIDISNDRLLEGIESVLGKDITIFGATSSDNMRGIKTNQIVDGKEYEHAAFAVAFCDETITVDTQASHGFVATKNPMVATKVDGNRILELDNRNAWQVYTENMWLPHSATPADTIPIGALAEALPADLAIEYGNKHILRVVTHTDDQGALIYSTDIAEGTNLWLTIRDESLIFTDMDRMIKQMNRRADGKKPIAVFQADCLARGRRLFNRIIKEELVHGMQYAFSNDDIVPPWLGMYGFGEYAKLGGRNTYHNYTTALLTVYRSR